VASAYDSLTSTCYDREYLFQLAELDPAIHSQVEQAVKVGGPLNVATEPYHPRYFLINGRSMPDDMDTNYAPNYPNQPYNGNPHMHPGDLVLLRIIGVGRWQHPLHEHGNHVRILARDGNLLLSAADGTSLAGPLLFTTSTTPGVAMDGIFYWTGKGLNWDVYGHNPKDGTSCIPDANGYYTAASGAPATAPNYYEWCADHAKPLETRFGGPATLPDANILTNGAWYGGSPYLGVAARSATGFGPTPFPPGTFSQNAEAGFAFMWHSHNEREITTNDVFPGGMMMMMIVDPPTYPIDESQ
jgi:FtsP/CotA-like multicopper oxidase with cupredoxin domain